MKSLLTILLVLLAIPVMAQDEPAEIAKEGETLPEVLGVCGAIHRTVLNLGPRNLDGQLDTNFIWVQEDSAGFNSVVIPAPPVVKTAFLEYPPMVLELHEFKGTVQAAVATWRGSEEEMSALWDDLLDQLVRSKGPPAQREDGFTEWREDAIRTAISWPENEEDLVISFSCIPTEDEYFSARDAAEKPDEESVIAKGSPQERAEPDPWTRETIASILEIYGQPSDEPTESGEDVVGLHYGGLEIRGWPYEIWFWFFEGTQIYSGAEFLPGSGSSNPVESFNTVREVTIGMYGEPDESILGEEGVRQRMIWRNGTQAMRLTFFEGDGNPWFLLDTYDTTHLDKIDGDLRPSRTLPNRYEPPPPDSGKDRLDLTPQVAEG